MITTIGVILVWVIFVLTGVFTLVCAFVGFMILWEMLKA